MNWVNNWLIIWDSVFAAFIFVTKSVLFAESVYGFKWSLLSALVRSISLHQLSEIPTDNITRDSQTFPTFKWHHRTHLLRLHLTVPPSKSLRMRVDSFLTSMLYKLRYLLTCNVRSRVRKRSSDVLHACLTAARILWLAALLVFIVSYNVRVHLLSLEYCVTVATFRTAKRSKTTHTVFRLQLIISRSCR